MLKQHAELPRPASDDTPPSDDFERYRARWRSSRRIAGLRFQPTLEAAYNAATRNFRVRELRLTISVSALFYVLWSVTDPVMVPDLGWLGFWLRSSVIPIALLFLVHAPRLSVAVREFYVAALGAYAVILVALIASLSSAPNAAHEFTAGVLTLIYVNTTYPLRFVRGLVSSAISVATTLVVLATHLHIAPGLKLSIGLLFVAATAYSLISCYRIERSQRLAFLLSRRDSQRLAAIAADRDAASVRSDTDALTGLPNRRHFDRRLAALLHGADRQEKKGLGLLMLDVDHFKGYNDHHGHPAGDAALHRVARIIEQMVREGGDFAARYGGEEFVLLVDDTEPARMRSIARRICDAIHDAAIAHDGRGDGISVLTVSIGAAITATGVDAAGLAEAATELIERADQALYEAKKAGRNRVAFASGDAANP